MANYILSEKVHNEIYAFYTNVSKKYKHTYSEELMLKNINDAYNAIYQIENGLLRRQPTISRWRGFYMATSNDKRWNFAYRIDGDTIYIEDACHAQNMHESKKLLRISESKLKQIIYESIVSVLRHPLKETTEKDSYQAKPKKEGRLNDWEINNIFGKIVSELVCSKRITPEDGEMLLYYGLYNNDCVSHVGS